jgi:peptide methionine sulfoxide reductase msrA/msrB
MATEKATFAGGCFWCMQPPYDKQKGVLATSVGYTGGKTPNPTYEAVCDGNTGHAEAVEITFDPALISYKELLDIFWRNIDPTTVDRQFYDQGSQYRTAIFYHGEEQRKEAEASKKALDVSGRFKSPVVTEISPAGVFYPAEEYHQKYYQTCSLRYKSYRQGSGRDAFIQNAWGDKK